MSTDPPTSLAVGNAAVWIPIPVDDELLAPPSELPPPLVDAAPALLNTHEMEWGDFERLILRMARVLDGAYDVRLYGRRGQRQHGLDVVGFMHGRAPSLYQAKRRHKEFSAASLETAVEAYAAGERPFDADRFVVAVTSEARDTAVIEKLGELRQKHADLKIDLWDRFAISEMLRDQPGIVETFFGRATAGRFCNGPPTPEPAADISIAADAILRGPIAHLDLADQLRRANEAMANRPDDAAHLLGEIADRLEASGFLPHSMPVRARQAAALHAAGRQLDEVELRLDLGWRLLDEGEPWSAAVQVRRIAELGDDLTEDVVRRTNALSTAASFRRDAVVDLDDLAGSFDELSEEDPHRIDAALILAEEAVADRRTEVVQARALVLHEIADSMTSTDTGLMRTARLLMCLADSGEDWNELARSARETYPSAVTALVSARHARHLALVPDPTASSARWLDAIERACVQRLNEDAATWLYALRGVKVQNGLLTNDLDDLHRHACALRAQGGGTVLPEPYDARERALSYLGDKKWPDALEALRRYLWHSVVTADWAGEIDAHEHLGDLFAATGRRDEAVRHYIYAGANDKLDRLCDGAPDEPTPLPIHLLSDRPWERAAAFSFAAVCADLLCDADATEWCSASVREIADCGRAPTILATDPLTAAYKAFGQLAVVATPNEAERFIEVGRALVPRAANTYRFTDEGHIHALIGIARAHPALRPQAVEQLVDALLADQRMAGLLLRHGDDLLAGLPDPLVARLGVAAGAGHLYASLALIAAEAAVDPVRAMAAERLAGALADRVHQPGVQTFGTDLPETAVLVTVLPEADKVRFAERMVEVASDDEETARNRQEALEALRVVSRDLPEACRAELFDEVMPFATGQRDPIEASFLGDDDPLGRVRFSFGPSTLAPDGLMTAGRLACNDEHYAAVQVAAISLLHNADAHTLNAIAAALASIPVTALTIDVALLATHPEEWLRVLAGVVWAQDTAGRQETGAALARDTSRHVRSSLARSLSDRAEHENVRTILGEDARRSVRHAVRPPA